MTQEETVPLLERAAATLRERGDHHQLVFELTVMAASIDLFPPEKVAEMLREAAEAIKAARSQSQVRSSERKL